MTSAPAKTGNGSVSRVHRTRAETQATYDRISGVYDWLEGYWERSARKRGLRLLDPIAGDRVLDLGTGTGRALAEVCDAVSADGVACGVDLSGKMLQQAQRQVRGRASLVQADASRLPFRSASFDGVFMSFVLELFDTPEIPQVLSECRRVLRESGRMVVVSLSKEGPRSVMRNLYEWGHAHFPAVLDCRPIFVERSLEDAGFEVIEASRFSLWGLPVEAVAARPHFQT